MLAKQSRRRRVGGLSLATAIVVLILNEFWLHEWLGPVVQLVLYFLCFLLTMTAVVVALAEVRVVASKSIQEQQRVFDSTLGKIQEEVRHRRGRHPPSAPPGRNNGGGP